MITRIHSLNRRCEIMHACMLSQFVFLEPLFLPVKTAEARRLETADCDTVSALFLESRIRWQRLYVVISACHFTKVTIIWLPACGAILLIVPPSTA